MTTFIAAPNAWDRAVHQEPVWGTVVTIDIRGANLDPSVKDAIAEVVEYLHQVDRWFSTYRMDSPISALRMGFATVEQMPAVVREILDRCQMVKTLTNGIFDPWSCDGGVDPSGFVKGWAADVAADMIVARGFGNVAINAAGDIACRGHQSLHQPWVTGVRHPDDGYSMVCTVSASNQSIATSGEYERGHHIVNPLTGQRDVALRSATVVGPDGGVADALATALLIVGTPGVVWFAALPEWSAYLIEGETAHFFGPAFAHLETLEPELSKEMSLR